MSDTLHIHTHTVERCRSGNRKAQKELYQAYAKGMFHVSMRILQNAQEAEDVLQESFVKAFTSLDKLQSNNAFGSWLKRIVVNNSINQLNKKGLYFEEESKVDERTLIEEEPVELPWHKLTVNDVKGAMMELSDGYRAVFSMYMFDGHSHAEIAEVLKISESTSKSQLNRAKKRIKETLEKRWI